MLCNISLSPSQKDVPQKPTCLACILCPDESRFDARGRLTRELQTREKRGAGPADWETHAAPPRKKKPV